MPKRSHVPTRLCLAAIAAFLVLAPASADAKRHLGFGAMGVNLDPQVVNTLSGPQLDAEAARMARAGVESVRTNLSWAASNPARGVYRWSLTDRLVHAFASHGIQLLPVVEFTPRWASRHPRSTSYAQFAPRDYGTYGTFLKAAIRRYGPHGSYWRQNPKVHKQPVRLWSLWNEPSQPYPWQTRPWARNYVKLLRAGYRAVHSADRGAKVVTASFSGHGPIKGSPSEQTGEPVWGDVADLYRVGGRHYFDILAINFYTDGDRDPPGRKISASTSVNREFLAAKETRAVMHRYHDLSKPVWLTEVTWHAALGKVPRSNYTGSTAYQAWPTTPAGQAARLTKFYKRLASRKGTYGLTRGYWFAWNSTYGTPRSDGGFDYTGLNAWHPGSVFRPEPILNTYRNVAALIEGCHKGTNARHCA